MVRYRSFIALCLTLLLTGCAARNNVIVVSRVFYDPFYSSQFFGYAARKGVLPVEIYGNPFAASPLTNKAAEEIASTLITPGWLPRTRFTTQPTPDIKEDFRLVLVFNPQHPAPGGSAACGKAKALPVNHGGGPIRLQAAFCAGDEWLTEAFAEGPPASRPNDPDFHRLISHLMLSLLPFRNPEHDNFDEGPRMPWSLIQSTALSVTQERRTRLE